VLPDGTTLTAKGGNAGLWAESTAGDNSTGPYTTYAVRGGTGKTGYSTNLSEGAEGGGPAGVARANNATNYVGGGGGAFFGNGLDAGIKLTGSTTVAEVWVPSTHGYGGGGGSFWTHTIEGVDTSGRGGSGCIIIEWEGSEYGT
jgi:hypothetical protein